MTPYDRPNMVEGITIHIHTNVGKVYVTLNSVDGKPFEVFLVIGKVGQCVRADAEAYGRLISYILQIPSSVSQEQRIKSVVTELLNCEDNGSDGTFPNSVGKVLGQML